MNDFDNLLAHLNNAGIQVSTNPQHIQQAISNPDNIYAALEEVHSFENSGPTALEITEAVEVPNEEAHEVLESIVEGVQEEPDTSREDFTDNDWNSILEDVGFNSTDTTEINTIESTAEDSVEEIQESIKELPPALLEEICLQPNSPSLLQDDSTSRFSGTEWYREIQKSRIILAGIGGIGSNVAFQLARMVPEALVMYDNDIVESSNMSGQLFSTNNIGTPKVTAISNFIRDYTCMSNPIGVKAEFTCYTEAGDIMICGFDNMSARYIFYHAWKKHVERLGLEKAKKCLFIDGRLSIDTLQVFAITGDDHYNMGRYEREFLFSQEEADETICSLKQTTYLACMIGSMIVNLFTNFIANSLNPTIPYDLPFFTQYEAQPMLFKTEA